MAHVKEDPNIPQINIRPTEEGNLSLQDFYAVYDKYQRGEYITSEDINTLYEVGEPAWAESIAYEQKLKLDTWDPSGPAYNIQMGSGHVGDWFKPGDNPVDVPQVNIPSYIKRRSEAKNQNLGTLEEEIDFLKAGGKFITHIPTIQIYDINNR